MGELILGDERHDVVDVDTQGLDLPCNIEDVLIVYGWDENCVHLHDHPPLQGFLDPLQLVLEKDGRRLKPLVALSFVVDVVVDLLADIGIDGVQGHREVGYSKLSQKLDLFREEEAVCA